MTDVTANTPNASHMATAVGDRNQLLRTRRIVPTWRRLLRNRRVAIGIAVLMVMYLIGLLAPWLSPSGPECANPAGPAEVAQRHAPTGHGQSWPRHAIQGDLGDPHLPLGQPGGDADHHLCRRHSWTGSRIPWRYDRHGDHAGNRYADGVPDLHPAHHDRRDLWLQPRSPDPISRDSRPGR